MDRLKWQYCHRTLKVWRISARFTNLSENRKGHTHPLTLWGLRHAAVTQISWKHSHAQITLAVTSAAWTFVVLLSEEGLSREPGRPEGILEI